MSELDTISSKILIERTEKVKQHRTLAVFFFFFNICSDYFRNCAEFALTEVLRSIKMVMHCGGICSNLHWNDSDADRREARRINNLYRCNIIILQVVKCIRPSRQFTAVRQFAAIRCNSDAVYEHFQIKLA